MPYVKRSRGVDAHEFKLRPLALAYLNIAIRFAGRQDRLHLPAQPFITQSEVDETRRSNPHPADCRRRRHVLADYLRYGHG